MKKNYIMQAVSWMWPVSEQEDTDQSGYELDWIKHDSVTTFQGWHTTNEVYAGSIASSPFFSADPMISGEKGHMLLNSFKAIVLRVLLLSADQLISLVVGKGVYASQNL